MGRVTQGGSGVTQERSGSGWGHTGKGGGGWVHTGEGWRWAGSHREGVEVSRITLGRGGVTQRGVSMQWQCVPDHDCHLRGSKPLAGLIPVIPGHLHKVVEGEGTGLLISEP